MGNRRKGTAKRGLRQRANQRARKVQIDIECEPGDVMIMEQTPGNVVETMRRQFALYAGTMRVPITSDPTMFVNVSIGSDLLRGYDKTLPDAAFDIDDRVKHFVDFKPFPEVDKKL